MSLNATQLKEFLAERAEAGDESVNMLDAFMRLTLECIERAGFGYAFNQPSITFTLFVSRLYDSLPVVP